MAGPAVTSGTERASPLAGQALPLAALVAEPDGHMTLAVLLACDSASLTIVDVSLVERRVAA